jgi:D-3-phosphoglycerate dehydrogenase
MMKKGSLLVNTSRGAVLDQAALTKHLSEGHFSAALDVFETEPLPKDDPLRGLPNVFLMPHMGGPTVDLRRDITKSLLREAYEFLENGAPLPHEISRAAAEMMSRS